jgi:hypothetical protein
MDKFMKNTSGELLQHLASEQSKEGDSKRGVTSSFNSGPRRTINFSPTAVFSRRTEGYIPKATERRLNNLVATPEAFRSLVKKMNRVNAINTSLDLRRMGADPKMLNTMIGVHHKAKESFKMAQKQRRLDAHGL